MQAVKGVNGTIYFVPLSASQPLLLPTAVGSQVKNNDPGRSASTVKNQNCIFLLFIRQNLNNFFLSAKYLKRK